MALAAGQRLFKQGQRLHGPVNGFITSLSSAAYAFNWINGQKYDPQNVKGMQVVNSELSGWSFVIPATGPLEQAMADKAPPDFGFVVAKLVELPGDGAYLGAHTDFMTNMITPIFCLHFETCYDWLKNNGHSNTSVWPMTLDFARVIRNAAAHGGRLEIKNANYRAVKWNNLAYKPADTGKRVIGTEIFMGDLLALMIEVDDELVALGAP